MIWMTLAELLPDALKQVSPAMVASTVLISVCAMLAFQHFLRPKKSVVGNVGRAPECRRTSSK
jgi:hypothetical protein